MLYHNIYLGNYELNHKEHNSELLKTSPFILLFIIVVILQAIHLDLIASYIYFYMYKHSEVAIHPLFISILI